MQILAQAPTTTTTLPFATFSVLRRPQLVVTMPGSKTETLALAGALGGGVAALLLLWIQKRRKDDVGAIPAIKLPAGSWFSIQALFKLGKDNIGYGSGRLILQAVDPSIGIGSLVIFGQKTILLRDPELVQEVLQKNHQAGGDYGKSFKGSPLDGLTDKTFGRGLFFAEDQDPQWAVAHKILTRPFSHRGILNMVPLMCEQVDCLVAALECKMRAGESVHMYDYLVKMALETIAVCSMGTPFDSFNSTEPHPFPVAFQAVLDAMFALFNVPTQLWSCCVLTMWRMQKAVGVMNGLIDEIIRKRFDKETSSSGKAPDLLDLMLAEGSKLSRENVRSQILTFLFAGHDSTAAAMSSLIVFLVANPRVEARLVAEIQQVVGSGEVQAHHVSELTYLDWCLKETLRLLPPAGSYQRMAFQDTILGGKWKLKQYTPIWVDVFALHMDPETWGADAACFVPERWEKGPPHAYSYMPFASGPRSCIGKEFSIMEQKIVAVKLLQRFTMHSPTAWTARTGSVLIKASESLPHTILGIDAEFSPQQFFVGASIPVLLQLRDPPC
ncbi:unnamed protein product [Polarella glacialis]|uniref:Cytochrome P450 n=1 Tax=Polarella glacialis TaxID=89957 RepID=A0A813LU23_POLGL|nr:unnamed protein product [Polarella glacialis]CAE8738274.1 unnamed protein product [Polarella glacialis]